MWASPTPSLNMFVNSLLAKSVSPFIHVFGTPSTYADRVSFWCRTIKPIPLNWLLLCLLSVTVSTLIPGQTHLGVSGDISNTETHSNLRSKLVSLLSETELENYRMKPTTRLLYGIPLFNLPMTLVALPLLGDSIQPSLFLHL